MNDRYHKPPKLPRDNGVTTRGCIGIAIAIIALLLMLFTSGTYLAGKLLQLMGFDL